MVRGVVGAAASLLWLVPLLLQCGGVDALTGSRMEDIIEAVGSYEGATLPPLVEGNYTRFAIEGPRPYTLIAVFVTRAAKYRVRAVPRRAALCCAAPCRAVPRGCVLEVPATPSLWRVQCALCPGVEREVLTAAR
jgi:hypothetical protein